MSASRTKGAAPDPREEAAFIEETAILYETLGLPRIAGRIIGRLLICDPPHQSLSELGASLKASKASISMMTRFLLQIGIVKRVSLPGERRDYVTIPLGWHDQIMAQQTERTRKIRQLAEHGLQVLTGAPPARRQRLEEMRDLYAFFEREMPALLDLWGRQRNSNRTRLSHPASVATSTRHRSQRG